DDLAVRICNDRIAYAQALATLEELRADSSRLAFAASGGPLLRRIRRLIGASIEDRPATVREIGGLTFMVIGLGLIILGISLLLGSPLYQAVARIKIEPDNSVKLPSYGEKTDPSIGYPYFMQTEFAVIQSDLVLRQVATELNLSQEW